MGTDIAILESVTTVVAVVISWWCGWCWFRLRDREGGRLPVRVVSLRALHARDTLGHLRRTLPPAREASAPAARRWAGRRCR
jgi:hypothetical protein